MNEFYFHDDITTSFNQAFKSMDSWTDEKNLIECFSEPFRGGVFKNFFEKGFIDKLKSQVLSEKFYLKSNDLYHFYQSDDLKNSKASCIIALRELIYSQKFINWMSKITGIELNSTIDLSAHRYPPNGHLLCHDDLIGNKKEGRRIAFIIYLVESDWAEEEGGLLNMFGCDFNNNPTNIVRSIKPENNKFAFFEVSSKSHHEGILVLN
jgi:Rps23 Pro-64 3,4-dihydroxylase Tpa1-like proline 4-hydroxylase